MQSGCVELIYYKFTPLIEFTIKTNINEKVCVCYLQTTFYYFFFHSKGNGSSIIYYPHCSVIIANSNRFLKQNFHTKDSWDCDPQSFLFPFENKKRRLDEKKCSFYSQTDHSLKTPEDLWRGQLTKKNLCIWEKSGNYASLSPFNPMTYGVTCGIQRHKAVIGFKNKECRIYLN